LVQVGFEPKLAFICPLCNKEVELVFDRSKGEWVSDHAGCLNFSVIRRMPRWPDPAEGPLVFAGLESNFSVRETVEGLRALVKEESDQSKRQKLETGVRRLESKLGSAEKNLPHLMDVLKSGAFGLKVVSGKGISALVWKSGERYFGVAESEGFPLKQHDAILAADGVEEAEKFISYWLRYWEQGRIIV
jgi:hypothetical protein